MIIRDFAGGPYESQPNAMAYQDERDVDPCTGWIPWEACLYLEEVFEAAIFDPQSNKVTQRSQATFSTNATNADGIVLPVE